MCGKSWQGKRKRVEGAEKGEGVKQGEVNRGSGSK